MATIAEEQKKALELFHEHFTKLDKKTKVEAFSTALKVAGQIERGRRIVEMDQNIAFFIRVGVATLGATDPDIGHLHGSGDMGEKT